MLIKGEGPCEEQHGRSRLTAHADPVATKVQWQGWLSSQHRGVVLVRTGDETAGQAGLSVVLPKLKQSGQAAGRARL